MISQAQIIQALQAMAQRNNQGTGEKINSPVMQAPGTSLPQSQRQGGGGLSVLGFLGGLGDSRDAKGNIDPSILTQLNQNIMGMTGQQGINQQMPWLGQTGGQMAGQALAGKAGGIMNFLAGLL